MTKTKSESDGEHPSGNYLVVEDPEKSSTWHLRVRDKNGNPDHTLMGAAWAALHSGYRGNKYEGPNKEEALSKLKAIYHAEKMPTPMEARWTGSANGIHASGDTALKSKVNAAIQEDPRFDTDYHGCPEGTEGDIEPEVVDIYGPDANGDFYACIRKDDGTLVKHGFKQEGGEVKMAHGKSDSWPTPAVTGGLEQQQPGGTNSGTSTAMQARATKVESASRDAHEYSSEAETAEDHDEAAGMHEQAAKLAAESGDAETAAMHLAHAKTHRALADKMRIPGPVHARAALVVDDTPLFARDVVPFDHASAPTRFMWMPAGIHYIECSHGNKDWAGYVECKRGDESIINEALNAHLDRGRKPFTDFDHKKLDASTWPKRFVWQDSPAPGIYEEPEWTQPGLEAVQGKKYRAFSPGFFVDAVHGEPSQRRKATKDNPAQLIGAPLVMGGLTNIPAFADIEPLWGKHREPGSAGQSPELETSSAAASAEARAAGAHTSETVNASPTQPYMKPTKAELQQRRTQLDAKITELTAKNDQVSQAELRACRSERDSIDATILVDEANERVAALEAKETKRKEDAADSAVELMASRGLIPMLDKDMKAQYREKFIKDPDLIPLFTSTESPLAARQMPNGNGAGLQRGGSTRLIHGERKIKAVTVLKEGLELCARSRKVKNAFGARITAEMAEEKGRFAREFHALYANDITENKELLNMRIQEIYDALEASTDADTIGTLAGTVVLQRTLEFFRINYPIFRKIYTDFSDQPALLNQTLETRSIGTLAVQTYNNQLDGTGRPQGWSTVSAATTTDVPLSVSQHVGVPVVFGANTLSSTLRRLFDEMAPAMSYALAKYFVQLIYALFTPANYNAYAAVNGVKVPVAYATYVKALIDFGRSAMVDLNAIFNPNEVPLNDRCVLLNSAYFGQASKDPSLVTFWAGQQNPEIITEGELPKMSKFIPIEAPDLPATNNLVGMALQKNGVVAISRIPSDYTKALPGASYGTSTMVSDAETGMTVMLVQYVNHTGGYAESRMETMIGGVVGDKRGGLCITAQ